MDSNSCNNKAHTKSIAGIRKSKKHLSGLKNTNATAHASIHIKSRAI